MININITPNWNILLWFIFISFIFSGFGRILLGLTNQEKDKYWDGRDAFIGFIQLILAICFLIFG